MEILLNNTLEKIEVEHLTVEELLRHKNFTFKMLIIKLNGKLVKKSDYHSTTIRPGDEVEVLHLISGG